MRFPTAATAILTLLLPVQTGAYVRNYLPLSPEEISHRVPQKVLRHDAGRENLSGRFASITFQYLKEDNQLRFSGADAAGKPWKVTVDAMMSGSLFAADLDHNGAVDLIYAAYTGGNGLAPPIHVFTLMFETDGRPVPSEMDGYFEVDARGLVDLVDLDGDGRAELIRQSYDDGYWITSSYEARDAHWHRVNGPHAGRSFPLYTRFTNRPNRVPVSPAAGRHPIEDDLSNDTTSYSGTLSELHWANTRQSENVDLQLTDGTVCTPISWYSTLTVIRDTPAGRSAATLGAAEEAHRLLDDIIRANSIVEIRGNGATP